MTNWVRRHCLCYPLFVYLGGVLWIVGFVFAYACVCVDFSLLSICIYNFVASFTVLCECWSNHASPGVSNFETVFSPILFLCVRTSIILCSGVCIVCRFIVYIFTPGFLIEHVTFVLLCFFSLHTYKSFLFIILV